MLLTSVDIFNGFANRFLWWCVRRSKSLPLASGMAAAEVERLAKVLGKSEEVLFPVPAVAAPVTPPMLHGNAISCTDVPDDQAADPADADAEQTA